MVKKFKMHISHHNQMVPWENEQARKDKPKGYNGWFTIDELREKNLAFSRMPEGWEPKIARNYQDHIDIVTPWKPIYFVWCSAISDNEDDWNE